MNFECPHGCGRKFPDQPKMEEHVTRRHTNMLAKSKPPMAPSLYENLKQNQMRMLRKLPKLQEQQSAQQLQSPSALPQTQPQPLTLSAIAGTKIQIKAKSILRPSSGKFSHAEQQLQEKPQQSEKAEKAVKIVEAPPQFSALEILENKKLITRQLIYKNSDASDLEAVSHLSLKQQNLLVFESTKEVPFEDLRSLRSLTLSQNRLINVIGLGELQNLVELNISHNQIPSLQPLSSCKLLQKLFASFNLITEIDLGLMIHLKVFHVGHNQLTNLEELLRSVQQMPSLKDLEVQGNPCCQVYAYKYDVLWTTFIERLDNQTITEKDYNLAQAFREGKSEAGQALTQSVVVGNRPTTAPANHVEEQEEQQADDYTLYLEEQLEEQYGENQELRKRVEKLEEQNLELRRAASTVPILEEQLRELQRKISCYETMMIFKDSPERELREYMFKLSYELETLRQQEAGMGESAQKVEKGMSKFEATQTTIVRQLSEAESRDEHEEEDDDEKYFRDDENLAEQPSTEIMDLIMRNSMSLSKLKDEFKNI